VARVCAGIATMVALAIAVTAAFAFIIDLSVPRPSRRRQSQARLPWNPAAPRDRERS